MEPAERILGVVTALWGRPGLTRLFLDHTARVVPPGTRLVAAVSPEDPDRASHPDWTFVEAVNSPLSRKFNAAMQAAEGTDAVLLLGSDDFVNERYVELALDLLEPGSMVMPRTIWFLDRNTKQAIYARCRKIGAGRVLSSSLLEKVYWQPWEDGYDKGADTAMDRKIKGAPIIDMPDLDREDAFLMDVKTDANLWSFDYLKRNLSHEEVDARSMLRNYVPDIADELMNA